MQNWPKPIRNLEEFKHLLVESKFIDFSDSLTGMIWLPYGAKIVDLFSQQIRKLFTDFRFDEYIFPILASGVEFDKLDQQISSFSNSVFKVDESFVLRPSGEIIIYPYIRNKINTFRDLPISLFTIGSSFRKGRARGLFRLNEANLFIEAHTFHSSRIEAENQLEKDNLFLKEVYDYVCLPFLQTERPSWTNKPVAEKHIGFDTLLPNGEILLTASSYAQMQIFSKVFDVAFKNNTGLKDFTYQTDLGFSSRIPLASLWLSSDQTGLCITPNLAPIQVVVVVIDNRDKTVIRMAKKLTDDLVKNQIRAIIDLGDGKLSKRFGYYEKKGVPIRIELGAKEIVEKKAKIVRRDNFQKKYFSFKSIINSITSELVDMNESIAERLRKSLEEQIVKTGSVEEANKFIKEGCITNFPLCQKEDCVKDIQKSIGVGEILGFKFASADGYCLACNLKTDRIAYNSRRF